MSTSPDVFDGRPLIDEDILASDTSPLVSAWVYDEMLGEMPAKDAQAKMTRIEQTLSKDQYINFVARFGRAAFDTYMHSAVSGRLELIKRAYDIAKQASKLKPENAVILKLCTMLSATLAEAERDPKRLYEFKEYLEAACKMMPNDHVLFHIRGRFAYNTAKLSEDECKSLNVPKATFERALTDLLRANEFEPTAIDNLLFIAKCYEGLGDYENMRHFLEQILDLQPNNLTDEGYIEEAEKLLDALSEPGDS
ncbi:unnamed protein product, partial [Mesorhabditis spiculigera]